MCRGLRSGRVAASTVGRPGSKPVPSRIDLDRELAVQKACLEAAEAGLLLSAHDCSDGGLAVTLAESCFSSLGRDAIGAEIDLEGEIGPTALLFS